MIIDHVTVHVEPGTHEKAEELLSLMGLLGLVACEPREHGVPEGATVTWWRFPFQPSTPYLHLIDSPYSGGGERSGDRLQLGHFCVVLNDPRRYKKVEESPWCVRASGSGRCWVEFGGIRMEVRP